ncbi:hypothetical protein ILUMI_11228 [Ignelater luminosus]|uniref:Uncharacterized protein n=1 Tax=Ignelater luminosus TaxID=2038154 RepID=A0A8K0GDF2_IGNLU|nr:hypothetical protein ILUMI_11228 [Ignelater luminosus]
MPSTTDLPVSQPAPAAERKALGAENCAKAVALVEDARSQRYMAGILNVSHSTIQRVLARFRETGRNIRRPG